MYINDRQLSLPVGGRLLLLSIGKAGPPMARAAHSILGDLVRDGLVTEPRHSALTGTLASGSRIPGYRYIRTEHPLPGPGSLEAGQAAEDMLEATSQADIVLVLLSGGGSAMVELPLEGVSLADLRRTNELLLAAGMPIDQVNTVRSALSQIKSGGLARMASPAKTAALVLSDVLGDRLSAIASGPTVLRRPSAQAAGQVLREYGLWHSVPESVRETLQWSGHVHPRAPRPLNAVIGNNRILVDAAAKQAARLGFRPVIVTRSLSGEARLAGERLAARLRSTKPGSCLLMGGEATVTVQAGGRGGRNQELGLAAAIALADTRNFAIMTLASDGVDGPTDAAGAIIEPGILERATQLGFDPVAALEQHDSYPLLEAVNGSLKIGPTGTNLNDIVIGLKYAA